MGKKKLNRKTQSDLFRSGIKSAAGGGFYYHLIEVARLMLAEFRTEIKFRLTGQKKLHSVLVLILSVTRESQIESLFFVDAFPALGMKN